MIIITSISGPKCESSRITVGASITLPNFCTKSHQYALKGDFNGDGHVDILCHDPQTGRKVIYYGSNTGYSGIRWEKDMRWCRHSRGSLYVGDFNGDNRTDILCHDTDGYVWIAYADNAGTFNWTGWEKDLKWCNHPGGSLYVGDFNGDKRTDILCHNPTGYMAIAYADNAGTFDTGIAWGKPIDFCTCAGCTLCTGDFNKDGKSDIICKLRPITPPWSEWPYAYATADGNFDND